MIKFPHYKQPDAMDCGPTCLRMVAKHYGKSYSLESLRTKSNIGREGVSMLGISDAAECLGFRTMGVRISLDKLFEDAILPCIIHWKQNHFVVLYKIKNNKYFISDPAHGLITYTQDEFVKYWLSTKTEGEDKGIALILDPTPEFYAMEDEKSDKATFGYLLSYLRPYKKYLIQLVLGLLLGSLLQLILPFLTQAVVDVGIGNQNLNFVYLVLIAQLVLFFSRAIVDFIRSWILLHIGTRINISLVSDFLVKLMKLPISFFDAKMIGDIMQRITDNHRIEAFLTQSILSILFATVNFVIFSIVLAIYNIQIFLVFLAGSALYALWIILFLKKRRELDFKRFQQSSDNQNNLYQMITGMQEIKLNNCEKQRRWEWEHIQARLFKVSIKGLALSQYQQAGSVVINETKNIIISFMAAKSVIDGNITLGMMMSIQYILGQLNSPIEQMIGFMQQTQDAKISLERLGEIHQKEDEEKPDDEKINILPENRSLKINNLSFQYDGAGSEKVLDEINLEIPQGKITAIVGTSGSGKTTLVKLLLGFYPPVSGEIKVGESALENISNRMWRSKCGAVMQDGFIFSDTIAKNITISEETINKEKLLHSVNVANIREFVETLPLAYNTKIGGDGHGLSQGQKQRMLIARAVYKNPEYIFFDEATNALDANNEKKIMENLDEFFKGKTVVVVAHRLSTVKNADQIVVLEKGKIVELGNHQELVKLQGKYYELVKNQLELGN
ncbi:MAG: peptidase domain-containing ABC transporter [Bacteroidota bacterium]